MDVEGVENPEDVGRELGASGTGPVGASEGAAIRGGWRCCTASDTSLPCWTRSEAADEDKTRLKRMVKGSSTLTNRRRSSRMTRQTSRSGMDVGMTAWNGDFGRACETEAGWWGAGDPGRDWDNWGD